MSQFFNHRQSKMLTFSGYFNKCCFYMPLLVPFIRGTLFQFFHLSFIGLLILEKNAQIIGLRNIKAKGPIKLSRGSQIDARNCKELKISPGFVLGPYSILRASGSMNFISDRITIQRDVKFSAFCYIGGGFGLEIGENCMFGPYTSIHPENHIISDNDMSFEQDTISGRGIKIASGCWFGAGVRILDGALIGEHVTGGAQAVFSSNVYESFTTYVGLPARACRGYRDR
jgi:acetyltransferase-like isoleucine patch superfamily enzyme